ncbi:MAG: EthD domain-containing protein [Pseudomonadota bacterium]
MIKLVMPLKRKPGMSTEDFRAYYENHHRLIGEKYLAGYAMRYVRRFMNPLPDRSGNLSDPEYDVLLEIWYPDEATFRACSEKLRAPEAAQEIAEDEEKLFDRSQMRSYLVEEHESTLDS